MPYVRRIQYTALAALCLFGILTANASVFTDPCVTFVRHNANSTVDVDVLTTTASMFVPSTISPTGEALVYLFGGLSKPGMIDMSYFLEYNVAKSLFRLLSGVTQGGIVANSASAPGGRSHCDIVFDTFDQSFYMHGGSGYDGNGIRQFLDDFWRYSYTVGEWKLLNGSLIPTANHPKNYPAQRAVHRMDILHSRRLIFLYGGIDGQKMTRTNDLFEYNIINASWSLKLDHTPNHLGIEKVRPPGKARFVFTVHQRRESAFIFGGYGWGYSAGSTGYGDDLFEMNLRTFKFTHLSGHSTVNYPGSTTSPKAWVVGIGVVDESLDRLIITTDATWQFFLVPKVWKLLYRPQNGQESLLEPGFFPQASFLSTGWFDTERRSLFSLYRYMFEWKFCPMCPYGTFSNVSTGQLRCDSCPRGYGVSNPQETVCVFCAPGKFLSPEVANCKLCESGSVSFGGTTMCESCPSGATPDGTGSSCDLCVPGTYEKSHVCTRCPGGTFQELGGTSFCELCQRGRSNPGSGKTSCLSCTPGKFSSTHSSVKCDSCSPGRFSGTSQATECQKCPGASYASKGADVCVSCLPSRSPENDGYLIKDPKSSIVDCFCKEGYYGTPWKSGGTCTPCVASEGVSCDENSPLPLVAKGYFRSLSNPSIAYACIPSSACAKTGYLLGTLCAEGYTGKNCGECVPDKYFRFGDICEECSVWASMNFFVVFFALLTALWVNLKYSVPSKMKSFVLFVSIYWLQLLDVVASLSPQWPPMLRYLFGFASLFNFNLDILSPECTFTVTYWVKWHVKMTSVLVLGALQLMYFTIQENLFTFRGLKLFDLSCGGTCLSFFRGIASRIEGIRRSVSPVPAQTGGKEKSAYSQSRFVYAFGNILFSLYTLVASTSLEMFKCVRQSDGSYLMQKNMVEACFSPYWLQILVANVLFSAHVLVGVPVKLWRTLKSTQPGQSEKFFGAFMIPYRAERFWWPVYEIVNRLFIVFCVEILGFYAPKLGLSMIILDLAIYCVLLSTMKPFRLRLYKLVSFWYVRRYSSAHSQVGDVSHAQRFGCFHVLLPRPRQGHCSFSGHSLVFWRSVCFGVPDSSLRFRGRRGG